MKTNVLLIFLVMIYFCLVFPFTSVMKNKPVLEKLGYVPSPEIMRFAAADQKQMSAASLVMKVLFYFGGIGMSRSYVQPDYEAIRNVLEAAVKLDPFNMDAYYFAQAVMVWDMKQVRAANELLEYGMQYRDWDWYLPYSAGFNYGYFLKDYSAAAKYFKRVGDLTGNGLSITLAGRYMYEAGQTEVAIAYLTAMVKSARNQAIKKSLNMRLEAFKSINVIKAAQDRYQKRLGRAPSTIETLLKTGYLKKLPMDPYGGTFYFDEKGQVRTTSKLAFGIKK